MVDAVSRRKRAVPAAVPDAGVAARAHAGLAIRCLAEIAADAEAPASARVAAAARLLERGFGRGGAAVADEVLDGISDEELDRMLRDAGGAA